MRSRLSVLGFCAMLLLGTGGCMGAYIKSVGGDTERTFSKIFLTDFNTAWQSVLDSLKSYPLDVSNREAGSILTKWNDNTAQKNFVDSFAGASTYLKAQFRFKVNVEKGFYNGQQSVKVSVIKEQMVQQDVLEGWRPVPTDSYDENTMLYRVGRIIYIRLKMARLEEEKTRRELEQSGF
ncbi:MAG: hypothetical protein IT285_08855 [Bdellovibrionales bacterium]|nr:hypothetical protein [Bdellovibrionales bacterium]